MGGRSRCLDGARAVALAVMLAGAGISPAVAAGSCPTFADGAPPETQPASMPMAAWQARVQQLDGQVAQTDLPRVQMLFLGDSITQAWLPLLFDQFYGHRAPLNLGVLGDNTQGLLWRMAQLPLGTTLRPRVVVLLIGTNNLGPGVDTANVAQGIAAVVGQIRARLPDSHILLLGLLPRGAEPTDPLRQQVREVNARIARCADRHVTYLDPGSMLVDGKGRLSSQIAYDYLHPSWLGYAVLAAAMEPYVRQAMGD